MGKTRLNGLVDSLPVPDDVKSLAKKVIKNLDEQAAVLIIVELKDRSKKLDNLLRVMKQSLKHTPVL